MPEEEIEIHGEAEMYYNTRVEPGTEEETVGIEMQQEGPEDAWIWSSVSAADIIRQ